ncbi:Lipoyl synthase, mitochondrial [Aphelenchoides bicaudatus]|nr:Lipoyl synthase, mitochondrial [Aphelenchoides bicaudatus]
MASLIRLQSCFLKLPIRCSSSRPILPDGPGLEHFINGSNNANNSNNAATAERTPSGRLRLPEWLKRDVVKADQKQLKLKRQLRTLKLATVCEEARCPNINLKLQGKPGDLDPDEPLNTAKAVSSWGVDYIVLTSVDRDDIEDGGAFHIASTISHLKTECPHVLVEALVPDFSGRFPSVEIVAKSGLEVYAHNIETVRRLTPGVRDPRAKYDQSLATLEHAKRTNPALITKSSIMLGLGEADQEIFEAMKDLRTAGVEALTLGQYMQPTKRHLRVHEWVTPEKFEELKKVGEDMGFLYVASGPLVRSSYRAGEFYLKNIIQKRQKEAPVTHETVICEVCFEYVIYFSIFLQTIKSILSLFELFRMVIEVVGTVDRESGCYLAGEDVLVTINLQNLDKNKDDILGWICIQLHCDRVFPRGGRIPESVPANTNDSTSVKLPKEAIYSSKPDIIMCNWTILKGSSEMRQKVVKIPVGHPPTFKGYFIKYGWTLQIAVQRIDKPIQTLVLPLKVINSTVNINFEPPTVENPFLRNDIEQPVPLDLVLQQIEGENERIKKECSEGNLFASVNVASGPFKLGDVVQGCVEFPDAEEEKPTCIQMLVRAETVEQSLYSENNLHYTTQSLVQLTTAFMKGCHFRVPIKLSATPTFTEQSVKLTWRLHFEFMITKSPILTTSGNTDRPVSSIDVQTLQLDHPIFVHSCNPLNIGLISNAAQAQTRCAIKI